MSNTYYLVYNTQGADLGVFAAETPADAIRAMYDDAGYKGVPEDEIPGAGRDTLTAVEVTAIKGDKANILREIEDLLGSGGSVELAEAMFAEGDEQYVDNLWYVRDWDKALEGILTNA